MLWQAALPSRYAAMTDQAIHAAIEERRKELGSGLIILGHHYQQDEVIAHADFTGDSLKLSQLAAERVGERGAKWVVFCGVHFMAESADILTPEETVVILPDLSAGCSMADMASLEDVEEAWEEIAGVLREDGWKGRVIPITYINSSAAIKGFVGRHGGSVCTSSNARQVLEWAFAGGVKQREEGEGIKVMFFPDQHLGRNTAAAMGYDPVAQMCLWDPKSVEGMGGLDAEDVLRSDVILWKGHCSVHKLFRPEHVDQVRAAYPGIRVIVHPECEYAVVQKADESGSTEAIGRAVRASKRGERWAVGTEVHMVNRLANEMKEKGVEVRILSDCQCLCTTMYRIDPQHLLWVLDELTEGRVVNRITVDGETRRGALEALGRMLRMRGAGGKTEQGKAAGV